MQPFRFKIQAWDEERGYFEHEVDAIQTSAPGLLLTEADRLGADDDDDEPRIAYRLTHERSGMALTGQSCDAFGLLRLAATVGPMVDWTQDGKDVVLHGRAAGVQHVIDTCGVEFFGRIDPARSAAGKARLGLP